MRSGRPCEEAKRALRKKPQKMSLTSAKEVFEVQLELLVREFLVVVVVVVVLVVLEVVLENVMFWLWSKSM
jgi:hypothetical protein